MRSGGNSFNYFPENQLTKLAHLVIFKRVLLSCLENEGGLGRLGPLINVVCVVLIRQIHSSHGGSAPGAETVYSRYDSFCRWRRSNAEGYILLQAWFSSSTKRATAEI